VCSCGEMWRRSGWRRGAIGCRRRWLFVMRPSVVKARTVTASRSLGKLGSTRLAGGIEIVRASPKVRPPHPDPHDTPLLSLFPPFNTQWPPKSQTEAGSAATELENSQTNTGCRTRRSPELSGAPTSLLQEVRSFQYTIAKLPANSHLQLWPMRSEQCVPLSSAGRGQQLTCASLWDQRAWTRWYD
jgi:hypothetical protein